MKYHILGIDPNNTSLPNLLCLLTSEAEIASRLHAEKEYKLPSSNGMVMRGGFDGTLPDSEKEAREAVSFDNYEAAQDFIRAELAAGSSYHYALWIGFAK